MSRRRLNRKPNRFRRTSKPRGILNTIALGNLITESLKLATTKYPNDADVLQLKDQVAVLMSVAIPDNAKYYDLRDVYETIADFFVKKSMKLMSPSE